MSATTWGRPCRGPAGRRRLKARTGPGTAVLGAALTLDPGDSGTEISGATPPAAVLGAAPTLDPGGRGTEFSGATARTLRPEQHRHREVRQQVGEQHLTALAAGAGRPWALASSIGTATIPPPLDDANPAEAVQALLATADERLYREKEGRRAA